MKSYPEAVNEPQKRLNPWILSLIYLIVASIWITLSNTLVYKATENRELFFRMGMLNDLFCVFITAAFLFALLQKHRQIVAEFAQNEQELLKSEAKYRALFENAPIGIFQSTPEGRFINVNKAFGEIFGYESRQDVVDSITNIAKQIYAHPEQRLSILQQVVTLGNAACDDIACLRKDGSQIFANLYMRGDRNSSGEINVLDGFVVDTTERKRVQDDLRERKKRLKLYMQRLPVACIVIGSDFTVISWNPAAEAVFGYSDQEALGRSVNQLIVPEAVRHKTDQVWKRLLEGEYDASSINENITKDGRTIVCEWTNTPLLDDSGRVSAVISVAQDITGKRLTEIALKESEKRFRTLTEQAPIGIAMVRNRQYVYSNRAHSHIFGFDDPVGLIGTSVPQRFAAECQGVVGKLSQAETGEINTTQIETTALRKDGIEFPYLISIASLNLPDGPVAISFGMDMTELKQARELVIQAEKMSMIGGLTAGMAHEINNPLSIVIQSLQVIEQRLRPGNQMNMDTAEAVGVELELVLEYLRQRELFDFLANIRRAGERAAKIVKNMLAFSRNGISEQRPENINQVVEQAIEMTSNDYDAKKNYDFRHVTIERDYADELPEVIMDVTEMEQVLINLLKNAGQAMAENASRKPVIRVSTRQEDGGLLIKVTDNGPGMTDELKKRVFEPFFTTKEVGVGSGLGLYVSYLIITNNHQGQITVDSVPDEGTAFTISLPLTR